MRCLRISSNLWHFVRHLVGLHGFLIVGLPTEAHFKRWGFSILLQLSHHRDLGEVVQSRLDTEKITVYRLDIVFFFSLSYSSL